MAYISPNTDVYLIENYPGDRDYKHTLWFENPQSQYEYFSSIIKKSDRYVYRLTNYTYQRADNGVIRVGIPADYLYTVNYMMFRNTAYGNKWFYAFVDNVVYVNDNTTEVDYTVDVIQTWMFNYDLAECYVEREHSETDKIGDNLVDEGISTGDISFRKLEVNGIDFSDLSVVIATTLDLEKSTFTFNPSTFEFTYNFKQKDAGSVIGSLPSGVSYYYSPCSVQYAKYALYKGNRFDFMMKGINESGKIAGVQSVSVFPSKLLPEYVDDGEPNTFKFMELPSTYYGESYTNVDIEIPVHSNKIDGITVKNNKMFTYPYHFMYITNNKGNNIQLKFERWQNARDKYIGKLFGEPTSGGDVLFVPTSYMGMRNAFDYSISLGSYPLGSVLNDYYKNWFAQNKSKVAIGLLSSAVSFVSPLAGAITGAVSAAGNATAAAQKVQLLKNFKKNYTGVNSKRYADYYATLENAKENAINAENARAKANANLAGAAISNAPSILSVANNLATIADAKVQPDGIRGEINNSTMSLINGYDKLDFYVCDVRKDYAKLIDDFFTMYGYATNAVKVPNTHVRKNFTYVKTCNCLIKPKGNKALNYDDEEKITSIYNNGITFWVNPENVGDYSVDNTPIGR